ncbi:MAG: cytidylate kinase family protein, partial [Acidobacteriaceae bacterium]
MIRIITVEREYGSRGAKYAHLLAERLGWRLIDRCVIEEIA